MDRETIRKAKVLAARRGTSISERHAVAARLVAELWETRRAVISTQVLQEFYVNATRKIGVRIENPFATG